MNVFSKQHTIPDTKITLQEEKTLRYVAGFIPFSLAKRYKNQSSTLSKVILDFIETWRGKSDDNLKLEHTKTWCEKINRGGLFLVNDEFYVFIRRIENVARTVLNKDLLTNYKGEDLRDVIMDKLKCDSYIDLSWSCLTRNFENPDAVFILKEVIFKKWIGMRARSFVNAWIQIAKNKKKEISNKSEPSLRKTLNVKKNCK